MRGNSKYTGRRAVVAENRILNLNITKVGRAQPLDCRAEVLKLVPLGRVVQSWVKITQG